MGSAYKDTDTEVMRFHADNKQTKKEMKKKMATKQLANKWK